jgi:hypothetical protein
MRPALTLATLAACLAAIPLLAQGAGPVKVPAVPAAPSAAAVTTELQPGNAPVPAGLEPDEAKNILVEGEVLYKHLADRDPFSPLVTAKTGKGGEVKSRPKVTGIGRYSTESCNLAAVVKTSKGEVAWFAGPDGKAYKVTVGEEFADGKVTSISYELGRVVVQQELINDPTHVKPFRDLVLIVRSQGGESK